MYSLDQIKQLIEILENSKLSVMELTDEGGSIRLEKPAPASVNTFAVNAGNVPVAAQPETLQPADSSAAVMQTPVDNAADNSRTINAPMVGVFYAAASPESSPYVTVGQKVNKGDVVCIIEAMKLMNEITAEQSGTITEVCVNNGDIVEYGQALFKIS